MKKLILLALFFSTSAMADLKMEIEKVMDNVTIGVGATVESKVVNLARATMYTIQVESASTGTVAGSLIPQASLDCVNFVDVTTAQSNFAGPVDLKALSTLSYPCARVKIINGGLAAMTATVTVAIKGDY